MKEIISGLSLLFIIQGVGGLINHLTNGGKSWFLVNYIDAFQGLEIVLDIVFIAVGGIIALATRKITSSKSDK
ncbi:hypothetical protein MHB44_19770 [Lysinibacillus sp. FSL H8-0500]|jgi:hypothetical protein|uniref:Signal peptidase II n=2 Tax=Bacillota TaxID=1239 RepID=A0A3N9UG75_9BACI|nr:MULTISPECIES: hypothetical protein [Bacillota]KKB36988.1 hypothetical protein QY97_00549 [Bacillus thermotolerans]KKB43691.1 hypothetical protein QY96_00619 [Bacillus thermotolerans]MBM7608067.1 hypothetical protein [Lysinibacillus composti]MEC1695945.1 hypothetical protein [Schinkia azotoformans]RQW75144.1 hypothetical protein EBB45_07190 [Lysinibacillus composti]